MAKIDWKSMKNQAQTEARNIKLSLDIAEYIKNTPDKGFVFNNLNGEVLEITETRLSTLNRLHKYMKRILKLVSAPEQRSIIVEKQKELEKEIDKRMSG